MSCSSDRNLDDLQLGTTLRAFADRRPGRTGTAIRFLVPRAAQRLGNLDVFVACEFTRDPVFACEDLQLHHLAVLVVRLGPQSRMLASVADWVTHPEYEKDNHGAVKRPCLRSAVEREPSQGPSLFSRTRICRANRQRLPLAWKSILTTPCLSRTSDATLSRDFGGIIGIARNRSRASSC
jgi:hypothetical protein